MKRLLMQLSYAMTVCLILMLSPVTALAADNTISEAELDQMLAPIALYPDTVLTHILIASTYPLEVVQADRWAQRNSKLSSQEAVDAVENESWDPSVKALVAFPQILARLSADLGWTEELGEAFLQDEPQVLSRVQLLRQKADRQGSLADTKHINVERERDIIIIEPARKEIVYVPVYDTRVVYGHWSWPAYPPVYWHNVGSNYTNNSVSWGVSVNVNPWFYFGVFDWQRRHIIVNHNYYYSPPRYYPRRRVHFTDSSRWYHDNHHRRGVHYRNPRLNNQYNGGYGPKQSTREYKAQQNNGNSHRNSITSETRPAYQRRTAEQVNMPNRNNVQQDRVINRRDQATTTRELREKQRDRVQPSERIQKSIERVQPNENVQRPIDRTPAIKRSVPIDRNQPIDRAQPVQRTMPVDRSQPAATVQRQVTSTQRVRSQPPAAVNSNVQQQLRPSAQARPAPERTLSQPVQRAQRDSRPAAQRQTVISRNQSQRSID